jgi:Zn-dependent protease
VFLQEPPTSHYDLNFRVLGFPVRVHPGFFLLPVLMGANVARGAEGRIAGMAVLVFVIVFFVSILVHELGHALAFQRFGVPSRIVLYWLGGLAIPGTGGGVWRSTVRKNTVTLRHHVIVSAAGPLAGLALAAVIAGIVLVLGGELNATFAGIFPVILPDMSDTGFADNAGVQLFFSIALYCNVVWSILNLAPVLPLDGGQIARDLLLQRDPRGGYQTTLLVSVAAAAALAVVGFAMQDHMMGLLFAALGISSYLTLQQGGGGGWMR